MKLGKMPIIAGTLAFDICVLYTLPTCIQSFALHMINIDYKFRLLAAPLFYLWYFHRVKTKHEN
jgi:hypothetical protein